MRAAGELTKFTPAGYDSEMSEYVDSSDINLQIGDEKTFLQ